MNEREIEARLTALEQTVSAKLAIDSMTNQQLTEFCIANYWRLADLSPNDAQSLNAAGERVSEFIRDAWDRR